MSLVKRKGMHMTGFINMGVFIYFVLMQIFFFSISKWMFIYFNAGIFYISKWVFIYFCFNAGIFPYEICTDREVYKQRQLPPIEAFHSSLTDSHISQADYAHAQNVWVKTGCETMEDYTVFYLKSDIKILGDVFQVSCWILYIKYTTPYNLIKFLEI